MDKRLILSVAGSGKTYHLCHALKINERNLLLAYTNENINNLYKEVFKNYGCIPENTLIMTFDKFMLNYIARPFAKAIANQKDKRYCFNEYGCIYNMELPESYYSKEKQNNYYINENNISYYITKTGKLYGERVAKFINKFSLMQFSEILLKSYFDNIYIDEIQDFAGERFELLKQLIKTSDNILMVGDYYQHSVSNKIDKKKYPFLKNMSIIKYKEIFKELNVKVDESLLSKSRRCSRDICDFVKNKLDINITSLEINEGKVRFIEDRDEARNILKDNNIMKLVSRDSNNCEFISKNWGYSKGDTFNSVCVILNKNMKCLEIDICKGLSQITKNKLYVALTRTSGNLYILPYNIYINCNN